MLPEAAFTILSWDIPKSNIAGTIRGSYNSPGFLFPPQEEVAVPICCDSCDKVLQEGTQFCSNCGRKVVQFRGTERPTMSPYPVSRNRSPTRSGLTVVIGAILLAAKKAGIFWLAMGALLLVGIVGMLMAPFQHSASENSQSAANTEKPSKGPLQQENQTTASIHQQSASQDENAATISQSQIDYATKLQATFEQQGEDISVLITPQHELILTSDIFRNYSARESMAQGLARDPKPLCSLDIWFIKVGYSKGAFSNDVLKTISLGCTAAKAAYLTETKPLRDEIANAVNDPDGTGRIHAHLEGMILVVESSFFDDPQNGMKFAKTYAQSLLKNSQKLCDAAISQLQMKGVSKVVRTIPVSCN